jgi:hypothetical protein
MRTYPPYAKSEVVRRYISLYQMYEDFESKEPTTVCLYECGMYYGGPEEGGWYYERGLPIRTVCVFSKKQAIKEAIDLEAYARSEIGEDTDYLGWATYRVCYDDKYAASYPEVRPRYE